MQKLRSILPLAISIVFIILAITTSDPSILLGVAVTVVRRKTDIGSNTKYRNFTITGDNAQTLDTRLRRVEGVYIQPQTNAPTAVAQSTVAGRITLTFTAGGAFTAVRIMVVGF